MNTILLIGASRGIGLELARQYREAGWRVIATARNAEGLGRLNGLGCEPLLLDVMDAQSSSALSTPLAGQKLDLAVFVAGLGDWDTSHAAPAQEKFDRLMQTNAWGPMVVLPQIAPMLALASGTFAVISSRMGSLSLTENSMGVLYRMSKAAVNMFVRCAQFDHPGICCVALHPGWVQTEMGGPQAPMTVQESARSMLRTLDMVRTQRAPEHRGAFLNHDGSPLAW